MRRATASVKSNFGANHF